MYNRVLFCMFAFSSWEIFSSAMVLLRIEADEMIAKTEVDNIKQQNADELKPVIEHAKLLVQEKGMGGIPKILAIAGCSAVGKSFFANELAELLKSEGINVVILRADDFINPDLCDREHFHARFDYAKAHSTVQRILDGEKSIRKPAWNPERKPPFIIEEDFSVQGIDLILFEGEFTLCDDEPYDFRRYSEFGIFVDADGDDILGWDWIRLRRRAEKTKEEMMVNRRPYQERYRTYARSSRDTAAYLLLKDRDHRYTLQKR